MLIKLIWRRSPTSSKIPEVNKSALIELSTGRWDKLDYRLGWGEVLLSLEVEEKWDMVRYIQHQVKLRMEYRNLNLIAQLSSKGGLPMYRIHFGDLHTWLLPILKILRTSYIIICISGWISPFKKLKRVEITFFVVQKLWNVEDFYTVSVVVVAGWSWEYQIISTWYLHSVGLQQTSGN